MNRLGIASYYYKLFGPTTSWVSYPKSSYLPFPKQKKLIGIEEQPIQEDWSNRLYYMAPRYRIPPAELFLLPRWFPTGGLI